MTLVGMTRVLIAGAGIGGLALAQALRQGGVDVAVYERDASARTRSQGYRIHIDRDGNAALADCLPPEVLALVRATSSVNGDLVAGYTHRLERVMVQEFPGIPTDEITHVDRETLRQSLLSGLEDVVHFGRPVTGYTVTAAGRVSIGFDEGDLLVGADGVGSAVRGRLLPHAVVRDIGLRCLYGRMPIDGSVEIPADFDRGFCWVADETGVGMGFATVRFRTRAAGRADYLMVTLVATPERLGVPDARLFAMAPEELRALVAAVTTGWHPAIRALNGRDFFPIVLRAGERVEPWPSGPVTLLGDAIHTMPPTGGVGANTALQDAATLARAVLTPRPLLEAVAAYERVMLPRGFATVERSLAMAGQMLRSGGARPAP
ncbi:FAD-dependent monooxygenase [Dactylosporangium matsuzakiense]|uniref:Monooxygenase n=2 Tax=Dactylosporangium matsuzakiense TaxID=53360 RepID=A0A9W6KSV2_9ACTN|nr:monooxygenase [Dactylosporangium matsuzakiense]